MGYVSLCLKLLIALLLLTPLPGAPYRLNRSSDSALALYVDNTISAAVDHEGGLHVVYTDAAANGRWQIYYRNLKEGYWSIPSGLSSQTADVVDNRSPQIVFDSSTKSLYAIWLGLSRGSAARTYNLFVERVDAASGDHFPVKVFDYGAASFQPKVSVVPGKVFLLSEERPTRTSTVFRVRVLLTASGDWVEKVFENSATERISYPVIACSAEQATLLWVRTTSAGHDVMACTMAATAHSWSQPENIHRSQALPEALSAAAHGKLVSLAWSVRGGARNSILLQTTSQDGAVSWKTPAVFYSAAANAGASISALSDKEVAAVLSVSTEQGDGLKMKYSIDAGETWLPNGEVNAIDIGPDKDGTKAQRASLTVSRGAVVLAWEEWRDTGPRLVFKMGSLETLARTSRRLITEANQLRDRFPYYPQLWVVGRKIYLTYGSKRLPQSAFEKISTNDLYVTELTLPATAQRGGSLEQKKK